VRQDFKVLRGKGLDLNPIIKRAAVYSLHGNLPSSAATLKKKENLFTKKRFLAKMKKEDALKKGNHFQVCRS